MWLRALMGAVLASAALAPVAGATLPGRNGAIAYTLEQCGAGCDVWLQRRPAERARLDDVRGLVRAGGRGIRTRRHNRGQPGLPRPEDSADRLQPLDGRRSRPGRGGVQPVLGSSGRELVFTLQLSDSRAVLYRASRAGRPLGRVGASYPSRFCGPLEPDWSARGEIAFTLPVRVASPDDVPASGGIGVVRPDGRGLRSLTAGQDTNPSWSPSGKTLAFTRANPAKGWCGTIHLVARDGRSARALTAGTCDTDPTWSPDGREIAFARRSGARGIYVASADGRRVRRVRALDDGLGVLDVAWQPLPR